MISGPWEKIVPVEEIDPAPIASFSCGDERIVLDAKTSELADWYARNGFIPLKDNKLRMILPMKSVSALIGIE